MKPERFRHLLAREKRQSPCSICRNIWRFILKPILWILIIGVLLFSALEGYFFFKNLKREIGDLNKLQIAELDDISTLRSAMENECKSNNTLRHYLLLPIEDCDFFAAEAVDEEEEETVENALYYYLTLLRANDEKGMVSEQITLFVGDWNKRESDPAYNPSFLVSPSPDISLPGMEEITPPAPSEENAEEIAPLDIPAEEAGILPSEPAPEKPNPFLIESEEIAKVDTLRIAVKHEGDRIATLNFYPLEYTFELEIDETVALYDSLDSALHDLEKTLQEEKEVFIAKITEEVAAPGAETGQAAEAGIPEGEISGLAGVPAEGVPEVSPDVEEQALLALLDDAQMKEYSDSVGFTIRAFSPPPDNTGENGEETPIPEENAEGEELALDNPTLAVIEKNGEVYRYLTKDPVSGSIVATLPDGTNPVALLGLKSIIREASQKEEAAVDISELEATIAGDMEGRENYLLLGRNGGNVDTMILANIDHTNKRITLISIPRDLFMGDWRINAYWARYGMQAFIAKIEDITGQRITHYALIDFDIFIDGIDALGGIDVYVPRDIADPSYKTLDDGVWGTMYFEKGYHHVSGVQALRLARSRTTSSDFERAKRQHTILAAAKDKAKNLGISDADSIISLILSMIERVETDMTPQDAIAQFFAIKDYEVRGGNVLSPANALVSLMRDTASGAKMYTLSPRNDDWSLIKKYVWQQILKE